MASYIHYPKKFYDKNGNIIKSSGINWSDGDAINGDWTNKPTIEIGTDYISVWNTLPDETKINIIEMASGYDFYIEKYSGAYCIGGGIRRHNDGYIYAGIGGVCSDFVSNLQHIYFLSECDSTDSNKMGIWIYCEGISNNQTYWYIGNNITPVNQTLIDLVNNFYNGDFAPDYSWKCWPQLSGNSGNFLMDLSLIDIAYIGDGTPEVVTQDSNRFTRTIITNLRRIGANLQEGIETVVIYCGDNYATATRRTGEGIGTNIVYITLKFYFRSDVLAFTSPEVVGWYEGGEVTSPETWLCIIFDDSYEVAAVDYISYNPTNGNYKYNISELPASQQMGQLWIWLQDNGEYHEQGNPYDTGSTDNGGEPGTPTPQDPILDTALPTISGLNQGIVTLYHPTDAQISAISHFLWSDNVLDNFKKYFNNFADNILSLYMLPFTPASLPTKTFKVGNMVSEITNVEYVTARFYDIDMGDCEVLPRWGSYLDYAPFTKIDIYLPYLGTHSLDIDEIMSPAKQDGTLPTGQGSKLTLKYRLDILTGIIVAKIFVNGNLRYQFEGKCGATIPLTGQTFASMVQGIVQAGAGLVSTIATGGLTAPLSAAAAVSGTVNATKPSIERTGNISGDASMLSSNIPFITVSRPNKPLLEQQEIFTGFPSYKSALLGSFSGFTQVIDAHVEGISCTEEERKQILEYLKNGVII